MKITYKNKHKQSVTFSYSPPFILTSFDGLGGAPSVIQRQKSHLQDGSAFISNTLEDRPAQLTFAIATDGHDELINCRRLLSSICNNKTRGELIFEERNIKRVLSVELESSPFFPPNESIGQTYQAGAIDFIALDPYWKSEMQSDQLVVWEGGLEFPLKLPTKFARLSTNKEKVLLNEGDVETPVKIVFNGPATSPIKIINKTTDEFIEVKQDLLEGERLEINTAFGQKRVTKILQDGTEINAFHFITIDSTFIHLAQGNNLIDYSTGADYERAAVNIRWQNRYVGI